MDHGAIAVGFVTQWAWLIWVASMVGLSAWHRREPRRAKAGQKPRLAELAGSGICFALAFVLLLLSAASARAWEAIVGAAVGGVVWCLYVGRKWDINRENKAAAIIGHDNLQRFLPPIMRKFVSARVRSP